MDIRYQAHQPVKVQLLETQQALQGRIVQISGIVARIELDQSVGFDAPVRLDFDDSMLLGEVVASESSANGNIVTIQVRHAVPFLSSLGHLICAVRGEGASVKPGTSVPVRTASN